MDREGYSGLDGRTTIFDYWAPDALTRLYNNGHWNNAKLTSQERSLRSFYSTLLNICNNERCISEGKFFDLMYVNPMSDSFDPHKQYTFLRSDGKEAALIITNFSDQPLNTSVVIPQHAFDYLQLKKKVRVQLKDLLSDQTLQADLHPECRIHVLVSAQSGVILRWKN